MGMNNSNIEFKENRMKVEVTKKTYKLSRFTTDRLNMKRLRTIKEHLSIYTKRQVQVESC